MRINRTVCCAAGFVLVLGLLPSISHAYLDPGTGSFILQMIIAGALGAILYVKLAWQKTRDYVKRTFSMSKPDESTPDQEPAEEGSAR